MIIDNETGILVNDDEWEEKLKDLVINFEKREKIATNAKKFVLENCVTKDHKDDLITFLSKK